MKKGFTLVELVGVIFIIGIIALITVPSFTATINKARQKTYDKQVDMIETAAKEWGVDNIDLLPEEDSSSGKVISLGTLIEAGKIQNSIIKDPRTKDEMKGCVVVKYNSEYQQYEYKYNDNEETCAGIPQKLCTYIPQTGTTEKTVGAQYSCILKDKEPRTFYVLENIESSENISLIMDRNFTDGTVYKTLAWCIDGGNVNTCENINSKEKNPLKHIQDTFGDSVEVSFPTKDQIASANNGSLSELPQWLYDHLVGRPNPESGVYGYWTASPYPDGAIDAWYVFCNGNVGIRNVDNSLNDGVRPVITISKDNL